jgi:hypothetical protein
LTDANSKPPNLRNYSSAWRLRGRIKSFSHPDPGETVARKILQALDFTPLAVFKHHIPRHRPGDPTLDAEGWIAVARACAETFRQSRASLTSAEKEQRIMLPFTERFPEPAALARYDLWLRRKASSEAQLAVVRDIIERSFAGDCAIWVKPGAAELAWASGHSRETLTLALWLAAIAGLVERRRINGVWHYTAVPESWNALPDYDLPVDERRETEQIA